MIKIVGRRSIVAGALAAPMLARHGWAQSTYPNKPIRMIVPFAAAGTTDLLGRIVAEHLQNAWGANVVVENKSGAGGNIGAEMVSKAPADGYTLLLGTVGTAVTNQFLYKKMPYDTDKAFAPVALFGEVAPLRPLHDVPCGSRHLRAETATTQEANDDLQPAVGHSV